MNDPCEPLGYWSEVARRFQQPPWLTDVLLPLTFTLLGLGLAYVFLRQQLKHDRDLRRAEKRETAIRAFADETIELMEALYSWRLPAEYWLRERWSEWGRVHRSALTAELLIGERDALTDYVRGAGEIRKAWSAAYERLADLYEGGDRFDEEAHVHALTVTIQGAAGWLLEAARRLLAYDGTGPVPKYLDETKPLRPGVPGPDRPSAEYADEYEGFLRARQKASDVALRDLR